MPHDTLATRLSYVIGLSGLTCYRLDRLLAGELQRGLVRNYVEKIARGDILDPGGSVVTALAAILGTTAEYLCRGGRAPTKAAVLAAVAARVAGEHAAPVRSRA